MKLSVLTVPLYAYSLEETLEYLHGLGVQMVELGCGGFPGKTHLDPDGPARRSCRSQVDPR